MEKISALMDGELDAREAAQLVPQLRQAGPRGEWNTYHVIRDSLRGEPLLSAGFDARFAARLDSEPTVLAPRRGPVTRPAMIALSAAASLSAVAVVAWMALSANPQLGAHRELAKAPEAVVPAAAVLAPAPALAVAAHDGAMSEYLLAHQGVSPSTALQGVAPYVRSVSAHSAPRPR